MRCKTLVVLTKRRKTYRVSVNEMNIGTWERKKGLQALKTSTNLFEEGMKLVAT